MGLEEVKTRRLSTLPTWNFSSQRMLTGGLKMNKLKDEKLEIKNHKADTFKYKKNAIEKSFVICQKGTAVLK